MKRITHELKDGIMTPIKNQPNHEWNGSDLAPCGLLADFYKSGHVFQYVKGTEKVYSTETPRSNKYFPQAKEVVVVGLSMLCQKWLIDYFNRNFFDRPLDEVVAEYERYMKFCLFIAEPDSSHITALWNISYLPIEIKALEEGTLCPMRVPFMTIENTKPEFYWVTNFLETLICGESWIPITSATIALHYRGIMEEWAMKTVGNTDFVPFQGHDFSMRGMSMSSGAMSGLGHLSVFKGTDTPNAVALAERYYDSDIETEIVGCSVPATEHSVMCTLIFYYLNKLNKGETCLGISLKDYPNKDAKTVAELVSIKYLITEVYPTGIFSIVSDTFDLWEVCTFIVTELKDIILARDGKVVIRPDSGDPVNIICGDVSDIKNYNDAESLDDCKSHAELDAWGGISEGAAHGEMGDDDCDIVFEFDDKYYVANCRAEWGRHDKQYYYLESVYDVTTKPYELKSSDKGVIELLWDVFGGTVNEKGYKELDAHIGAIYGDAITPERCSSILQRSEGKGFASTNVVFGIGAFTYQHVTRDTFGIAVKSTNVIVDGEELSLLKDPITDDGIKKSQTGVVAVLKKENGELITTDGHKFNDKIEGNLLVTLFKDGILSPQPKKHFEVIRTNINNG
jgi:nicotinamide phosphoribosyltransferase